MLMRYALTAACFTSFVACSPTIDTSSDAALVASVARMHMSLPKERRAHFDKALLTVAAGNVLATDLLDLAQHMDKILPEARAAIAGKTAEQIIQHSDHILRQRGKSGSSSR